LPLAKSRDKEKKGNKKKRVLPLVKRRETKDFFFQRKKQSYFSP
jgi:hypothetical protein